jgi:hypothetical protein
MSEVLTLNGSLLDQHFAAKLRELCTLRSRRGEQRQVTSHSLSATFSYFPKESLA